MPPESPSTQPPPWPAPCGKPWGASETSWWHRGPTKKPLPGLFWRLESASVLLLTWTERPPGTCHPCPGCPAASRPLGPGGVPKPSHQRGAAPGCPPLPASSQHPCCRGWLWVPASGPKQGAFSASAASRKPAWGPSPASLCWNLQRRGWPRLLPSSTVGSPSAVQGRSQPSTQLSGGRTNEQWLPVYPKGSQKDGKQETLREQHCTPWPGG